MSNAKYGYGYLIALGNALQAVFLLIIRLFLGWQFAIGGWGKFGNIDSVIDFFTNLSIPLPEFNAYLVATVELLGGIMLIIGFGTRLAALLLSITMAVALATAHADKLKTVFSAPLELIEATAFAFLFGCLVLFMFGPGGISVDAIIKRSFRS